MKDNLESRSVTSVKWNSISNVFRIILAFTKSIILARLLPIETFGIYAGALAITIIARSFLNFGINSAFIYRCEETEDLENTSRIHFTLQAIISVIWTLLMLFGGFLFLENTETGIFTSYIVLTFAFAASSIANTPRLILSRSVRFKRLALMSLIDYSLTFFISILLALLDMPLAALLATNIITAVVNIIMLYIWRPVWRPKFHWDKSKIQYFITFGSKQLVSRLLMDALDRLDELWTNLYLGVKSLGFYSKAYNFAQYPSLVLAYPIDSVAFNTYAEISNDRKKLSKAFYITNSFLVLTGFFFVGALTLVAPEFIRILLGERWMPMLTTFRLMLPYTLFDPMKRTMGNLFIAVGKPGAMVKTRTIQLVIMIVGLYIFGNLFNIEGVALAVDLMMVAGIIMILLGAKKYVDISIKKLFGIPFLALAIGLVYGYVVDYIYTGTISDYISALVKLIGFSLLYFGLIFLLKKEDLIFVWNMIKKYILRNFLD
jgi:O-antigen/teichoic acid export membrane protein